MKIIYLFVLFSFYFFASFSAQNIPFDGWSPSAPGTPLNRTFFHRSKANAPIFLEVAKSGSPYDVNLIIHRYPSAPLPEIGTSATTEETQKHREALRQIYLDSEQSPPIGTMFLQFRAPDSVHLVTFSVLTPYREQCLGTHALVTALSMMKKKQNIRTVTLSIDKTKKTASRLADFYRRLGFQYGVLPGTFILPTHADMWLNLDTFNPNKPGIFKAEDQK